MKIFLIIIGVIIGLIVLAVAGLYVYSIIATYQTENVINDEAKAVLARIEAGELSKDGIQDLCREHPEYRRYLFANLKDKSKFPAEFATELSAAETDLVMWLMHPNELGERLEAVEFVEKINIQYQSLSLSYYLFKYKAAKSNWAYENGWMAGVSGPYLKNTPLYENVMGTFSEFEPITKMSNRAHVEYVHNKMADGGQYEGLGE